MLNFKINLQASNSPINCIWVLECDVESFSQMQKLLPHPYNALVFHYGDIPEYSTDGINYNKLPSIYFASYYLTEKFYYLKTGEKTGAIIVIFHPAESFSSLNFKRGCFNNKIFIEAEMIFGNKYPELEYGFFNCRTLEEKVFLITQFIGSFPENRTYKLNILHNALKIIYAQNGCLPILKLSEKCNVSKRTLERYFRNHLSTTPDQYSQIVRFNAMINFLKNNNGRSTQNMIDDLHFHDYSHLINEFRNICGETPKSFIRSYYSDIYCMERHFGES